MANLKSPFAAGAVQRLPAKKVGSGKLVIRVSDENDPTDRVYFLVDPALDCTAARATGFLIAGESVEICGQSLSTGDMSDVTILAVSGNPDIFFGVL